MPFEPESIKSTTRIVFLFNTSEYYAKSTLVYSGCICAGVRGWALREHSGDLCRSEVLQDADGDQHLHPHARSRRRVLPSRHSISHRHLRFASAATDFDAGRIAASFDITKLIPIHISPPLAFAC